MDVFTEHVLLKYMAWLTELKAQYFYANHKFKKNKGKIIAKILKANKYNSTCYWVRKSYVPFKTGLSFFFLFFFYHHVPLSSQILNGTFFEDSPVLIPVSLYFFTCVKTQKNIIILNQNSLKILKRENQTCVLVKV